MKFDVLSLTECACISKEMTACIHKFTVSFPVFFFFFAWYGYL